MGIIARRQVSFCLKNTVRNWGRARSLFALLALCTTAPAEAADLVGATAGELGVSPAGSASYSIPIALPPGTTGLQPKITLQYDSLAGNGPAGMGWSIGGLATITRCPTSVSIDGFVDPVDYDANDKFCLNGQRLVPVVGVNGADGTEYRTYQEEFSKVISYGTLGSGPQRFKVWRKSGEILEFGFTVDSRIEAEGRTDSSVWVWALNKLSDTYGNYETFSYVEDTVNGGYRISRIDYTGNAGQSLSPYNHIDFIYASRATIDPVTIYQAGSKITANWRLANIKAYADTTLFRDYQITYETTPGFSGRSRPISVKECATNASGGTDCFPATTFAWSPDGQKTLTTLDVTNGGISGSSWQDYNVVASGDFNGDGRTDLYLTRTTTEGWTVFDSTKPDHAWLSDGNGGFQDIPQDTSQSAGLPQGRVVAASGDFNGDGLTDLYVYRVDGTMRALSDSGSPDFVNLSNGNGTFTKVSVGNLAPLHYRVIASGDFNGDGLTDLFLAWTYGDANLMNNSGAPVVLLGNTTGLLQTVAATGTTSYDSYSIPATGDFNGDGLTDMYVFRSDKKMRKNGNGYSDHIWISKWVPNGSGGTLTFQDQTISVANSFQDDYGIAGSGDFNGDGLTDFYVAQMDANARSHGYWHDATWFSTGNPASSTPFEIVSGFPQADQLPNEFRVTGVGDFNGDGLTDLYAMPTQDDHPAGMKQTDGDFILRSKGSGAFEKIILIDAAMSAATDHYEVKSTGDFDGDGLADLYVFRAQADGRSNGNANDYIFKSAWKSPDQLTGITNGLGLNTQLAYKPLTDATVYTKGTGQTYPVQEVIAPRYVVSQVKADNGIGGQNAQNYTYEALRAHLYDIGNLGFGKMKVTDQSKGIVTESTYSQDTVAETQGLLQQSRTITPGGIVLEQQDVSWSVAIGPTSDGTPRLFRYSGQTITAKKDLNGALMPTVTETTNYDIAGDQFANYGFPRKVVVKTDEPDGSATYTKTTVNTYDHTESNWQLGRLLTATVTHHQTDGVPDIVRSSAFTYFQIKGVLKTETVEPSNPALTYKKEYVYTDFGAVGSLTETWGTQNNSSIKNPNGTTATSRATGYDYDARNRYKTHETNPLQHDQGNTYNPVTGVLNSTTGPNGLTTTWGQDAFGRPTRENRADSSYTTTSRYLCGGAVPCPANAVIKIVTNTFNDAAQIIAPSETVYQDKLYREVRQSTPSLNGTQANVDTIYDGQGRILKKSEPFFTGTTTVYWTTIQYDLIDRPILTTRPDLSTQSVVYNGLTVTSTNELSQQKIVRKNALGQTFQVTDDAGTAILYTYDAVGQLTHTEIAGVSNTGSDYTYDIRGNKITDSDPDKGAWSYSYNALGLVASQTDAKSQVTTMTYDLLGRMLTRIDDATAPNPGNRTSTWTYDFEHDGSNAKGKLTQISGPGAYSKYIFYDTLQREAHVSEIVVNTSYDTFTEYEPTSSRVLTVTYPSIAGTAFKIRNFYDSYGHLITVKNDLTNAFLWQALDDDERGNITEYKLGTQVHSIRAYDVQRGWLKSIVSDKVGTGAILQDLSYTFNALGNLTRRADHDLGANQLDEISTYDNLNRLRSSAITQSGSGGWSSTVTVTYDLQGLGNIKTKSDVGTYTYGQAASGCGGIAGGKHAVTTITGTKNTTYCYDRNGNMLSGDGRTITYTPYDLPQTITRGFSTVTFSYGPERARFKRVDSTAAGVTTTIYAADRSYEHIVRPNGTVEQKYYVGDFAVITRTGTVGNPPDTTNFLLGDHLGSVDTITNVSGVAVQRMSFDAWGKRREASWAVMLDPPSFDATLTTHGFTGHEEVDPVGLIHMNGRVYDPEIGRFLSADPFVQDMSNSQSLNRYTYVLNNPLSLTDPTGFFFGSVFKAIGNFIGKIFSGLASVFKAALKMPLIRAVVQIAACVDVTPLCLGVTGAMELVAGGSIGDAIKAMAFTVISAGTWGTVGDILHPIESMLTAGSLIVSSAVHGIVNGALSLAQGGTFIDGFVSGAIGQAAGMLAMGSPLGAIPGSGGTVARSIFAGAAGGAASELTGGKFMNRFVTAAFAHAWNQEGIGHNGGPPLDDEDFAYTWNHPFDSYGDIKIYDVCPMCRLGPESGLGMLLATGGAYLLRDPVTDEVMRTGRTKDLARREAEHARDPELRNYNFENVYRTNDYAQQRGLEQHLHDRYTPTLNKIRPISPSNPKIRMYQDAARQYLLENGGP